MRIDIIIDSRQNVVVVPRRAVISQDGSQIVRVRREGAIENVPVVTGLSGFDGYTEIISGVQEGDEVVVFENK